MNSRIVITVLSVAVVLESAALYGFLTKSKGMRYDLTTYLSNCRQLQLAISTLYADAAASHSEQLDTPITKSLVQNNYLSQKDLDRLTQGRGAYFIFLPAKPEDKNNVRIEFMGDKGFVYMAGSGKGDIRRRSFLSDKAEQDAAANP